MLDKFPALALPTLYRAAIGSISAPYYLQRFTQFEADGRVGWSWNWSAGLNTINWLVFRKLMLPLLVYLVTVVTVVVVVMGTGRLILHWTSTTEWMAWAVVATSLLVLPGLLGNGWFYRQCRRDIEQAIQASPTLEDACQLLSKQASTQARLWLIATANLVALAIGLALMWAATNRASEPETVPEDAPTPLRQFANVRKPPNASESANTAEPASASEQPASAAEAAGTANQANAEVVVTHAPAAPLSAPTPQTQSTGTPLQTLTPAPAQHYVNVGLFADPDNARRAYVKLVKSGLPASREVMMLRQQRVTRVRCGPFDSRDAALAAVQRIRALALDAVLAKPETTHNIAGSTKKERP